MDITDTQRDMICEYMLAGASITALEAKDKFGCMRLAAIIFRLKKTYNISKETIRVKNKFGKMVSVASYRMEARYE